VKATTISTVSRKTKLQGHLQYLRCSLPCLLPPSVPSSTRRPEYSILSRCSRVPICSERTERWSASSYTIAYFCRWPHALQQTCTRFWVITKETLSGVTISDRHGRFCWRRRRAVLPVPDCCVDVRLASDVKWLFRSFTLQERVRVSGRRRNGAVIDRLNVVWIVHWHHVTRQRRSLIRCWVTWRRIF